MFLFPKKSKTQQGTASCSRAELRTQKDLEELSSSRWFVENASVRVEFPNGRQGANKLKFIVNIGLSQGPYRGATFPFSFSIPTKYPYAPPTVVCTKPLFHPCVDQNGLVTLGFLMHEWSPILDLNSVIYGLQVALLEPIAGTANPFASALLSEPERFRAAVHYSLTRGQLPSSDGPLRPLAQNDTNSGRKRVSEATSSSPQDRSRPSDEQQSSSKRIKPVGGTALYYAASNSLSQSESDASVQSSSSSSSAGAARSPNGLGRSLTPGSETILGLRRLKLVTGRNDAPADDHTSPVLAGASTASDMKTLSPISQQWLNPVQPANHQHSPSPTAAFKPLTFAPAVTSPPSLLSPPSVLSPPQAHTETHPGLPLPLPTSTALPLPTALPFPSSRRPRTTDMDCDDGALEALAQSTARSPATATEFPSFNFQLQYAAAAPPLFA